MCLWLEVGHQDLKKKKKTVPPDEEYLKSLTQRCTESLSTSAVLNCKLFRSTLQNKRTIQTCEGGPDCVLIHPTAMNPSLHTITQRTQYVGAAFSFVLFFFLTILYRRINTTTEWRSLWKCDIFSAVNFLMQVPVSSLHYTSPLYLILTKSAPLYYAKGFMNHSAIIKRFTQKMNTRRVTFSIDLRI